METLVALFLMAVMLAIFSGLFRAMTQVTRQNEDREDVVNGIYALEEMRRELLEAVRIASPTGSVFETTVVFQKLAPGLSNRLPPPGEEWEHFDPLHLLNVRYELEGERWISRVLSPSNSPQSNTLANNVDGFSANLDDSQMLELRISFRAGRVLQSYSTKATRWTQ